MLRVIKIQTSSLTARGAKNDGAKAVVHMSPLESDLLGTKL